MPLPVERRNKKFGGNVDVAGTLSENVQTYNAVEVYNNADTDLSLSCGVTKKVMALIKFVAGAIVNKIGIKASTTGNPVEFAAEGTDTDISIKSTVKGAGIHINTGPVQVPSYAVATVPAAAAGNARCLVWLTDGNAGAACLAISTGSAWKVIALGSTAAAS